jgi:hypothetical protein
MVSFHGYRDNHFGRRVCGLEEHYFCTSGRFLCQECKENWARANLYSRVGNMEDDDELTGTYSDTTASGKPNIYWCHKYLQILQ